MTVAEISDMGLVGIFIFMCAVCGFMIRSCIKEKQNDRTKPH